MVRGKHFGLHFAKQFGQLRRCSHGLPQWSDCFRASATVAVEIRESLKDHHQGRIVIFKSEDYARKRAVQINSHGHHRVPQDQLPVKSLCYLL
jgi:hypothetical protein